MAGITAKIGCKYSTLFSAVPGCKFAVKPKNRIGLNTTERLGVKVNRTINVN